MLRACLLEPPKVAQISLMTQLMPLLPGWVFAYERLTSLLRVRNMSQSSIAMEIIAMNRLSRIVQGWLVARFRLPWKNWPKGREEKFYKPPFFLFGGIKARETRFRLLCLFQE